MDRLETVRMRVDAIIQTLNQEEDRKFAYLHLYGVSQCATMLALMRGLNAEWCAIAAMLHDIATYALNIGHRDHAQKSAAMAEQLLHELGCFQQKEIVCIVYAIAHHSEKQWKDDDPYAEVLKDADVLEHYLYHPHHSLSESQRWRLDLLHISSCALQHIDT